MNKAHDYAATHFDRFRQQLYELIRIPSVSTQPQREADVHRAAEWIAEDMRRIGLNRVEVLSTGGHPVVYGEWMGAGQQSPTVLVYGHYDVQPAARTDGWNSDPFEPTERDGVIYARGAADDKGQMVAQLKAAEALLATGGAPVNIKFLIEGEEEIGSVHLGEFVRQNHDRLKADVCVISDSGMPSADQPSIIYALRGMVQFELDVYGPQNDLHSGSYGGAVHNPAQALTEIIARLHTPDGRVAVPGFYDDVLPLDDEERAELSKSAPTEADWKASTGVPQSWGEAGYPIYERTGARPTLEINGIAGGFFETGFKGVIPSKAWAKMSCRLVANQDPRKIGEQVVRYVQNITPPTVRSEIRMMRGSHPAFVDIRMPAMQAAITAYEQGWGKRPIFAREGGSVPVVVDFQRELDLPVILMGFGLNADGAHGPNEHFSLDMFRKGINTAIYFHEAMSQRGPV
jgi:acetylornithine deacetylase/succinyl-diaminopimelate desuccinylase-like protein